VALHQQSIGPVPCIGPLLRAGRPSSSTWRGSGTSRICARITVPGRPPRRPRSPQRTVQPQWVFKGAVATATAYGPVFDASGRVLRSWLRASWDTLLVWHSLWTGCRPCRLTLRRGQFPDRQSRSPPMLRYSQNVVAVIFKEPPLIRGKRSDVDRSVHGNAHATK
jgi:hypothetical protein